MTVAGNKFDKKCTDKKWDDNFPSLNDRMNHREELKYHSIHISLVFWWYIVFNRLFHFKENFVLQKQNK